MKEDNRPTRFLQQLIGTPLSYAVKHSQYELYGFGFGKDAIHLTHDGSKIKVSFFTLHALCDIKIIRRIDCKVIGCYSGYSSSAVFRTDVQKLLGKKVKDVQFGSQNNLWINLGDYAIILETNDDGEESWRFFTYDDRNIHLVVSDTYMEFQWDENGKFCTETINCNSGDGSLS